MRKENRDCVEWWPHLMWPGVEAGSVLSVPFSSFSAFFLD